MRGKRSLCVLHAVFMRRCVQMSVEDPDRRVQILMLSFKAAKYFYWLRFTQYKHILPSLYAILTLILSISAWNLRNCDVHLYI